MRLEATNAEKEEEEEEEEEPTERAAKIRDGQKYRVAFWPQEFHLLIPKSVRYASSLLKGNIQAIAY